MKTSTLEKLNVERSSRRAAIVLTDVTDGQDRLIKEDEAISGGLGEAVTKAFRNGKSGMVTVDGREMFLNVHVPPPKLVVIGAVHISQALAVIAKTTGYDMHVIDPRTAFATPERFEGVTLDADWPEDVLKNNPLDAYTALAAVTHDPKVDDYPLQQALKANCFYVGALGSRKTHAKRVDRFLEAGLSQDVIDHIKAPIGLNIGASTPQEIAIAVMAEVIEAFRKRGLDRKDNLSA